jgi:hypothetical protein
MSIKTHNKNVTHAQEDYLQLSKSVVVLLGFLGVTDHKEERT